MTLTRLSAPPPARSVLDCGGKRSATPLSDAETFSNRRPPSPARKRRRRFALPAHSKTWRSFVAAAFLFAFLLHHSPFVPRANAQYAIPWFKIAGGGGMQSTGGVYTLSGTIGQVDTGRVAGGTYRSEGGFWAIAIQQLGYPPLNIAQSGTNALVSWATVETGFILQSATDLGMPTAWTDSGLTPVVNATTNYVVTVPLDSAVKTFFRLRRP